MVRASTNMADMATRRVSLSSGSSALATLASQAYPVQAHQSSEMISTPRSRPCQLSSSAMYAVTWVSANTNTRSKKSSSGLTAACCRSGRILLWDACTRIL